MTRLARVDVFAADEVAIFYFINRTVRRCFLLDENPVSGKNSDHRKRWLDEPLIHLVWHVEIDFLGQSPLPVVAAVPRWTVDY